ncbi:IMP cyclohydrolase [Rhizobium sp. CF142]|nr:IMP cyclohydrolase [Rhizobium sp. CF142]
MVFREGLALKRATIFQMRLPSFRLLFSHVAIAKPLHTFAQFGSNCHQSGKAASRRLRALRSRPSRVLWLAFILVRRVIEMYVGRIVGVGRDRKGDLVAAYRVSSRSFPNRNAEKLGDTIRIVAQAGSTDATSDSPYIAYECLIWNSRFAVVGNGTQTRPIYERLKAGNTPRDAIVSVLVGLDREFDQHDTPRICGLVDLDENRLWLGSVTADSLSVMPVEVQPGQLAYIATYEFALPRADQIDQFFDAGNANAVCHHITHVSVFSEFEKPVCAASWIGSASGQEAATFNCLS